MKDIKGLAKKVLRNTKYVWIPLLIVVGYDVYQSEKQYTPERKAIVEYVSYINSCLQKDRSKISVKEIQTIEAREMELKRAVEDAMASVEDKTVLLKYFR